MTDARYGSAKAREIVRIWKGSSDVLQRIRDDEIKRTDTRQALMDLADAFAQSLTLPPRASSGLVEQQTWFQKMRM